MLKKQLLTLFLIKKSYFPNFKDLRDSIILHIITQYDILDDAIINMVLDKGLLWVQYIMEKSNARRENNLIWLNGAVKKGYRDIVEYIDIMNPDILECYYNQYEFMSISSNNGHLNIIKYLSGKGIPIYTRKVLETACINGYLDIVKFLIKSGDPLNYITIFNAIDIAIVHNRIEIVKYLVEDCVIKRNMVSEYQENGQLMIAPIDEDSMFLKKDILHIFRTSIDKKRLEIFYYLYSILSSFHIEIGYHDINTIIRYGYLDMLKVLMTNEVYKSIIYQKRHHIEKTASIWDRRDILEYLMLQGYSFIKTVE